MYKHERSLVDEYSGRPFVLLGVNNDKKISRVKKAVKENNLNWRSWIDGDSGPIVKDYGIRAFPTTFVIDHKGVIRYKSVRGDKLDAAIKELVEEAEADGATGGGPTREFVDVSGKHTIVASYVGFKKGKVQLVKEDGEETSVPWKKLNLESRQYVAQKRLVKDDLSFIAKRNIKFEFDDPIEFVSGKHTLLGTYMGTFQSKVIIWDQNGKELRIARSKLDDDTLDRIKEIGKQRRKSSSE